MRPRELVAFSCKRRGFCPACGEGCKRADSHSLGRPYYSPGADASYSPATKRISWARLLKRVFDIDIKHCPHCGGALIIVAAILESGAITKIFYNLDLPVRNAFHANSEEAP